MADRRLHRLVATAGAVAALAATGCGGASSSEQRTAEPLGKKLGGSVATLADCADWRGGSHARKLATIADIRNQVNRDDTGVDAPPLSDEEALELFDTECAAGHARSFRLYVMYTRAAGWAPLLRDER